MVNKKRVSPGFSLITFNAKSTFTSIIQKLNCINFLILSLSLSLPISLSVFILNSFCGLRCPMFVDINKENIFMHMLRIQLQNFNGGSTEHWTYHFCFHYLHFIEVIFVHKVYSAPLDVFVAILCFCFVFFNFCIFYPYFCWIHVLIQHSTIQHTFIHPSN